MDTSKPYILLLIDIQKSTRIQSETRKNAFERLLNHLPALNHELTPQPELGLSLNYGDEISGLFSSSASVYNAIINIRDILHPEADIRYVVIKGKIGHDTKDITQVGGEVFKKANENMTKIKKKNRYCYWEIKSEQHMQDEILISLSELSNILLEKMTPYQRQIYTLLRQGMSQKKIAHKLKKHQQSVSEAVRRSGVELIVDAEGKIQQILNTL